MVMGEKKPSPNYLQNRCFCFLCGDGKVGGWLFKQSPRAPSFSIGAFPGLLAGGGSAGGLLLRGVSEMGLEMAHFLPLAFHCLELIHLATPPGQARSPHVSSMCIPETVFFALTSPEP